MEPYMTILETSRWFRVPNLPLKADRLIFLDFPRHENRVSGAFFFGAPDSKVAAVEKVSQGKHGKIM